MFQQLNEAYNVLMDDDLRLLYNRYLNAGFYKKYDWSEYYKSESNFLDILRDLGDREEFRHIHNDHFISDHYGLFKIEHTDGQELPIEKKKELEKNFIELMKVYIKIYINN